MSPLPSFLLLGLCTACVAVDTPRTTAPPIAILHANVLPMDRERVLPDQTVVVAGGKIVALGPASDVDVPGDAIRIEAAGRHLLPALCDMHVHLEGEAWNGMLPDEDRLATADVPFEAFLFPYVARGVTTVQVLSATADEIALRERIRRGEIAAPRLILAQMIDGPDRAWPPPISVWVDSPEAASEAVRRARAEGYDRMKVYSFLSREAYDAIVATAQEQGMDVIGHIPMSIDLEHAIESGQKLIAHSEELAKHAEGDYRRERIEHDAEALVEGGVWLVPTLATTRAILELLDDPERVLGRPEARYHVHPMQAGIWRFVTERLYAPIPEGARKVLRDDLELYQRPLVRELNERGGRLLAGSDTILPGLVPGFALHRELAELVTVGLTPYEALRTATVAPFEYLGEPDRGALAVGMRSDLILVDGNPLEDVSAAGRVTGVVLRGRWIGAEEIERRMHAIAASGDASAAHRDSR